jgi:S-DNA-T family DNA segregation ATPase FtsK/SpoIIIE
MFMDARDDTGESTLDIYKYQKYYRAGVLKEPMSHLFIISDEFAELKSQQPEFMEELISTARVGRSLGVHLILATQKPSGVVNDQIWSNSKFKICLKVQTAGDSNEMLKKPDAASIKETGRFYLQVGYDEYFAMGQSGWAGAKYVPSDKTIKKIDDSVCFINNIGDTTKSISDLLKKETTTEDRGDQLTNIVNLLCEWAKKENYQAKKMWLEPIPSEIFLGNTIQKYQHRAVPYEINPVIGEYDFPQKQKQGLLTLNMNKGNTYIFGKNGAGKEDLISTILYSTCTSYSPKEVNFYVVDMGAGTLRAFLKYPHVGDVVTIDDGDKVIDLFALAEREIGRRKELTVDFGGSFDTYNQMNPDNKLPLMCVIINNLDVFEENFSKIADLIVPLYRDGAKYGVTFIISVIGINTLRSKVREYFTNHISLVCANKDDYFSIFTNYKRGLEPAQYKGRGLVAIGKDVLEFQSALINTRSEINTTIKSTCDSLSEQYKDCALKQLPSIPAVVNVENFLEEVKTLDSIPLGYNAETKEQFYFDFAKRKANLISSNDLSQHLPFLNALVTELKCLNKEQYDVQIIDFSGYFDLLTVGLTCYQSNFNDTLFSYGMVYYI